jgi:CxxC motif-containing protein (DUF1111 family)
MLKRALLCFISCLLAPVACTDAKVPEARVSVPAAPSRSGAGSSSESVASDVGRGRAAFERTHSVLDGLGPLYNEASCSRCHNRGGVGGSGIFSVTMAGKSDGAAFDPLIEHGGPLYALASVTLGQSASERDAIPGCTLPRDGEQVPDAANVVARRRTTALFGLGLVDATPDGVFVELAARQPEAIRGRPARATDLVTGRGVLGKFGWKAQTPSLFQFAAQAALNELGITNPLFQSEQVPLGNAALASGCDLVDGLEDDGTFVRDLTDFMLRLEPIAPLTPNATATKGDALFTQLGCDGCHVRSLRSARHPIAALSEREYHPYSDFLLHDMGSLGDRIGGEGDAAPREMRTAPLWGGHLVSSPRLLHDGRAKSFDEAIRLHDGQGAAARDAFAALGAEQREQLGAFLGTL